MKYAVVLCDGMADYPIEALGGKTPMSAAQKPVMDLLASNGEIGLVKTVPDGMSPGSDVANLSVMGYDPKKYYSGRSPLEAVSMGIALEDTDVTLRCNLVTLSEEESYRDKTMVDYCAGDISSEEAKELIEFLQAEMGNERYAFFPGVSYRHCLVWKNGTTDVQFTPPHDISGKQITGHLPVGEPTEPLYDIMKRSYELLKDHPVNQKRIAAGKNPASSIWLWGQGTKPLLDRFEDLYHMRGAVISAVDLLKGIAISAGMETCTVPGATGYIDTNYDGKVGAALKALQTDSDFVYIHIEAPDECGHRGEMENKVHSLELIDQKILRPLMAGCDLLGDYSIMVLPDHPTPLSTKTHASDPVPYLIFRKSGVKKSGVAVFSEKIAQESGNFYSSGPELMQYFLQQNKN